MKNTILDLLAYGYQNDLVQDEKEYEMLESIIHEKGIEELVVTILNSLKEN